MKPIIQEDLTGCGIASSATIVGISYHDAKRTANKMGIYTDDQSLWSNTIYVRRLLSKLGVSIGDRELPFHDWDSLPNCALLSIKWRLESGKPLWHWVVFVREGDSQYVLDSKKALKNNLRKDFGRMKPKWYIPVFT
jgi:hypothetical protein